MHLVIALACATNADSGESAADTAEHLVTDYVVNARTAPDPLVAGEEGTFSFEVRDQDDLPIEDLQTTHERVVHVQFVSHDLASFQHVHNEDFTPLTAENLRTSSFAFPLTLPLAGDYLTVFDFAHHNQYLSRSMTLAVEGAPAQAAAPDLTLVDEVTVDGVTGQLSLSAPPVPGFEAAWSIHVFDAAGVLGAASGEDVVAKRPDGVDPELGAFTFKRFMELESGRVLLPQSTNTEHRRIPIPDGDELQPVARFVAVVSSGEDGA